MPVEKKNDSALKFGSLCQQTRGLAFRGSVQKPD